MIAFDKLFTISNAQDTEKLFVYDAYNPHTYADFIYYNGYVPEAAFGSFICYGYFIDRTTGGNISYLNQTVFKKLKLIIISIGGLLGIFHMFK